MQVFSMWPWTGTLARMLQLEVLVLQAQEFAGSAVRGLQVAVSQSLAMDRWLGPF